MRLVVKVIAIVLCYKYFHFIRLHNKVSNIVLRKFRKYKIKKKKNQKKGEKTARLLIYRNSMKSAPNGQADYDRSAQEATSTNQSR